MVFVDTDVWTVFTATLALACRLTAARAHVQGQLRLETRMPTNAPWDQIMTSFANARLGTQVCSYKAQAAVPDLLQMKTAI